MPNFKEFWSEGSRALSLEASWEFPLRDLEMAADEIARQVARGFQYSVFSLCSVQASLCFILLPVLNTTLLLGESR